MTPQNSLKFTDRDLITSLLTNFYIVDYGFVSKVNDDNTVNVTHATKLKTLDGVELPETKTNNIELLTLSTGQISINMNVKQGDKVVLLGLKNFVKKVKDVTISQPLETPQHYNRTTLKALPLCLFNDSSQVVIEAEDGTLKIQTNDKIELNGNTKQFVTWSELNTALSQYVTNLNIALAAATYINVAGTPTPLVFVSPLPSSINIDAAKTQTVVTGG